ncbi:MAG: response regulator [Planctomycetia bacterium]|nr:response regulator [Planctomycetia bacterium]
MAHVLVVDDSGVDRILAGRLLERNSSWTVAYAGNGKEAIEQFRQQLPDLVVTDLQMPEMNGLELVERIRELHPGVPVVLMTGYGSEEIAREAIQRGAASYVPKQELAADLADTVGRLLATTRCRQILNRLENPESEFDCELENDLSLLSTFTQEFRDKISSSGLFHETECLRFATAVDEALMNAYFHGNLEIDSQLRAADSNAYHDLANQRRREDPYRDRHIHVHARIKPDQVTVTIRDDGSGFDQSQMPDPTDPEYLDRPYGRGILLMRTFADLVRYNEAGNEVTLVKWTE